MRATQLSTHKAMARSVNRFKTEKERHVPLAVINDMGIKVNKSIHKLKHEFDDYRVYDTDVPKGSKPILLEKGKKS